MTAYIRSVQRLHVPFVKVLLSSSNRENHPMQMLKVEQHSRIDEVKVID